jgi:hypothetical protein
MLLARQLFDTENEGSSSSETSVNFYKITLYHVPKYMILRDCNLFPFIPHSP